MTPHRLRTEIEWNSQDATDCSLIDKKESGNNSRTIGGVNRHSPSSNRIRYNGTYKTTRLWRPSSWIGTCNIVFVGEYNEVVYKHQEQTTGTMDVQTRNNTRFNIGVIVYFLLTIWPQFCPHGKSMFKPIVSILGVNFFFFWGVNFGIPSIFNVNVDFSH